MKKIKQHTIVLSKKTKTIALEKLLNQALYHSLKKNFKADLYSLHL
jgi:hypothetical protein